MRRPGLTLAVVAAIIGLLFAACSALAVDDTARQSRTVHPSSSARP